MIISSCSVFGGSNNANTVDVNLLDFETSQCRLPCFKGIVPGVTTFGRAAEIAGLPEGSWSTNFITDQGTQVDVEIRPLMPPDAPSIDEGRIAYIVLSVEYQNSITLLGKLLDAGYSPKIVYRSRVGGPNATSLLLVLGEEEQILAFVSAIGELSTDSPVYRIVLLSSQDKSWVRDDFRFISGFDYRIDWIGYAIVDEYMAQPTLSE
jgi:hypothetical protein